MRTRSSMAARLLVATMCLLIPAASFAQLQVGFYNTSCPNAEALVRQAVTAAFANNPGIAPGLIRLHFHDCFVRGCDASVLLTLNPDGSNNTERTAPPNFPSLRGFEVIDAAKALVERSCPRTVSCADILAFAARDSVNITATGGNAFYQVPAGRRDGNVSLADEANEFLPGPNSTATLLVDRFRNKTLTAEEMVVLSGSHTIGRSHCDSFLDRNRERLANGTISPVYQALLEALCRGNTTAITTEIDLSTPALLDNNYYKLLPLNLGLHFSDDQLIRNATLAPISNAFAANETLWKERFAAAMIKMGNIEPKTGAQGEIRLNCSVVNRASTSSMIEMLLPGAHEDHVSTS